MMLVYRAVCFYRPIVIPESHLFGYKRVGYNYRFFFSEPVLSAGCMLITFVYLDASGIIHELYTNKSEKKYGKISGNIWKKRKRKEKIKTTPGETGKNGRA